MNTFFDRVYPEPNTGCWLWAGAHHPSGHGCVNPNSHNGFSWAHRYSYFIANGDFDRQKLICHKCDNPWCVNPEHLYVGTHSDNVRDILERSNPKWATGSKIWTAKLNPETVRDIRAMKGSMSNRAIARKFSVTHSVINKIFSGKIWKEVI